MTDIPSTQTDPTFPTEWRPIDVIDNIECRQLADDTFQLRSRTSLITINKAGLDLFLDDDSAKWSAYLRENKIEPEPRDD